MCGRESDGLRPRWQTWPNRPAPWCGSCRTRYAEAHDAGRPLDYEPPAEAEDEDLEDRAAQAAWDDQFELLPAGPPCPLESHQVEAFLAWLAWGDWPAWSLEQVSHPSPN